MIIAGFHGTTLDAGENIIKNSEFKLSRGNKEWLGDGIYFYPDIDDAYNWHGAECVVMSIVNIPDDDFIDFDTAEGKHIYRNVQRVLERSVGKKISNSPIERQCMIANLIWQTSTNLQVMAASFYATRSSKASGLIETRDLDGKRREFCVRSNNPIVYTRLITRGEINGE